MCLKLPNGDCPLVEKKAVLKRKKKNAGPLKTLYFAFVFADMKGNPLNPAGVWEMLSGWLRGFEITIWLSASVFHTGRSNMRLGDMLTYSQYMDRAVRTWRQDSEL